MAEYDKMTKAELIEELKKKETMFSWANDLASSSEDAIIGKSLDGTVFSWNRSAENIYGYSAREIIGQNITILSPPDRQDEVSRILEKIRRGERIKHFETVRVTKDGRQINISLNISPIIIEAGDITGASTIAHDITERKKTEEALRQSEEHLRRSQEIARLGSWELDTDNNELSWSDEVYRIFGIQPHEFGATYEAFLERVHPEDRAAVDEAYSSSIRKGQDKYDIEHRIVKKDTGEIRIVHERCENIRGESGFIVRSVGMVQDITKRKRLENVMQARLRLLEFANNHSLDELLTATLDEIEALTGSTIGFYHFLESDQKTLTLQNWSTNTLKNMCSAEGKGRHYNIFQAGVWVDCLHEGRPVIHNDYASLPHRKGMPEGHAPVVRELVVPIFRSNQIKAIIGVGNKSTDYNENDLEIVSQLGDLSWDITERKSTEEALWEKTKELDRYFKNALDLLCIADTNGCFRRLNPQWESTLGYTVRELEGQCFLDFVHPNDIEATLQTLSQLSEQKEVLNFVNRCRCKNGSYRWIEWRSFPSGTSIYAVARDITERKRLEEELLLAHDELEKRVSERTRQLEKALGDLRISEERYALAVQGAKGGIWDLNLETGEAYHSPRWKSILGYEDKEISGGVKEWESRIHPEDYQRVMELFKAFFEVSLPELEFEHRLRHKDGSYRWIISRSVCLRDVKGKPYRLAGSISDVTERKKLEQQLLQAQKMESVGILAGGVAHDFNNLLTTISGYGQILQENIPEEDELSQESIRNVLKAADRAAELTRGLLAFSRKQVINLKPVYVDTLVSNTAKLIQRVIGEDIELSTNLTVKNMVVNADPGQIEQVLMNLATNARDAMLHGGHLSITASQVNVKAGSETQLDLLSPGKYALISVSDTGTGIEYSTLENIFEPFFTTKEVGKGTGLGLSIAHGIIKQHNGSIRARSETDKGTTIDIYLPLVKGHALKEESIMTAQYPGGIETLLVVEDEENVRTFTEKILQRAGYKVIIAGNGDEAVARMREHDEISLVLSDVVMPRKNGKEMLDEMRKIKPGIKAVFISGYAVEVMQEKGMFDKITDFIAKPFKKNDLLQKVREVLDKECT